MHTYEYVGIYFAVAFPDRIRILSLLLDDIAHVREISARSVSAIKITYIHSYIYVLTGCDNCSTSTWFYDV